MAKQELLNDMHLFVAVGRSKSFTRAAAALHISRSTLCRRIDQLEKAIGVRLLARTTRHVELTDEGKTYLARIEPLLDEAVIAHEDLGGGSHEPTGLLKVSMPISIVSRMAIPWLSEFVAKHPGIQLEVDTSPDYVDPVADRWDVCVHDSPVADSSLVVRTLASYPRALFASPDYIAARGAPEHPLDLVDHECICAGPRPQRNHWTLYRGSEQVSVTVTGRVQSGNIEFSPLFCIEGMGIAVGVPRAYAANVERGELVKVLPEWGADRLTVSAIIPNRLAPAKTRAFLNFFSAKMKWAQSHYG